jgi:hypothetical protein
MRRNSQNEPYHESLGLGRFVLRDEVATGSHGSWPAAHAWLPRPGCAGWSRSPIPCRAPALMAWSSCPATYGVIYQAVNAVYTGRATRRTLALLPDGTVCFSAWRAEGPCAGARAFIRRGPARQVRRDPHAPRGRSAGMAAKGAQGQRAPKPSGPAASCAT